MYTRSYIPVIAERIFDYLECPDRALVATTWLRCFVDEEINFKVAAVTPWIGGMVAVESRLVTESDSADEPLKL